MLKLEMSTLFWMFTVERRMMINKFPELQTDNDRLEEELMVVLVTDLQEKQTSESNAIQKIIEIQVSYQFARDMGYVPKKRYIMYIQVMPSENVFFLGDEIK